MDSPDQRQSRKTCSRKTDRLQGREEERGWGEKRGKGSEGEIAQQMKKRWKNQKMDRQMHSCMDGWTSR